jgi:ATP-binding cassette subfamily B protein
MGRKPLEISTEEEHSQGRDSSLSPELVAALQEPMNRPLRVLGSFLGSRHWTWYVFLAFGVMVVSTSAVLEGILFRGVLDVGRDLRLVEQRLEAIGCFLLLTVLLVYMERRLAYEFMCLGRRLEVRLRIDLLEKIPRLNDRYFHSRPTSDMAERSHVLYQVRLMPRLAGQLVRSALALLVTAGVLGWSDPATASLSLSAALAALVLPLAFLPLLSGLDLRLRTYSGALSRFYLDALLGLFAIRAHGAERAIRREQENLLVEWTHAGLSLLRWSLIVEGLQLTIGFGLVAWLLFLHTSTVADAGGVLLLAYWALSLPLMGEEIALLIRQYPLHRSIILRLLEPLGAPEETPREDIPPSNASPSSSSCKSAGVAISFEEVTVQAAGHTILQGITLHIEAGSHVAIVGASGSGKSSLVGLLLGWHRPCQGRILIQGDPLDNRRLDRLRTETCWVDPAIQLWNRSMLLNLLYGAPSDPARSIGAVVSQANLHQVLPRLPEGLQTSLGEGGGLLSGGEGQRVRFGRALSKTRPRLVILDEPFRGMDHDMRHELLRRARQFWTGATLLCITHDVGETKDFDRVLVMSGGRLAEEGTPEVLACTSHSHYATLLEAEEQVRQRLWSSSLWRHVQLISGRLYEGGTGESR